MMVYRSETQDDLVRTPHLETDCSFHDAPKSFEAWERLRHDRVPAAYQPPILWHLERHFPVYIIYDGMSTP